MNPLLEQTVRDIHLMTATVLNGTERIESELQCLVKEIETVKNNIKVLQAEKEERDKREIERDKQIQELHQQNTYQKGRIDVLQSQLTQILSSRRTRKQLDRDIDSSTTISSVDRALGLDVNTVSASGPDSLKSVNSNYDDSLITDTTRKSPTEIREKRQGPSSDTEGHIPVDVSKIMPNILKLTTKKRKDAVQTTRGTWSSQESQDEDFKTEMRISKVDVSTKESEAERKGCFNTLLVWCVEAEAEQKSAAKTAIRNIEGALTILLIDTSCSMKENGAWDHATSFLNDYLTGLKQIATRYNMQPEYVAIVTFGAHTRCQQRFTKDYELLKQVIGSLKLGGPSPLFGGLIMAKAVAESPDNAVLELENMATVYPKIILITDGNPTEVLLHSGPDTPDPEQMDQTRRVLLDAVDSCRKSDIDVFCVPVGQPNMEFLNSLLSKECGRRILQISDGQYFSRRLFLTSKLQTRFNLLKGACLVPPEDDTDINGRDPQHMQDIIENINATSLKERQRQEGNPYTETHNTRLLPVGSRVRRGPDLGTEDEDGSGPGTVVGHDIYRDMLWVQWDSNDEIKSYNYGFLDRYGVLPVDEPRIPLPGHPLDVGCKVEPGKDWRTEESLPPGTKGTIIRMGENKQGKRLAVVRWDNGKRGAYSYGTDRVFEIQFCLPQPQVAHGSGSVQQHPAGTESSSVSSTGIPPRTLPERPHVATEGPSHGDTVGNYRQKQTSKPNKNKNRAQ